MIYSASPQSRPAVIYAWYCSFGTYVRKEEQKNGRTCVNIVITTAGNVVDLVDQNLNKSCGFSDLPGTM